MSFSRLGEMFAKPIESTVRRWIERGATAEATDRERKHTRRTNLMALVFSLGTLPCAALMALMGAWGWSAFLFASSVLYATPLWLNPHGSRTAARAVPLTTATAVVYAVTSGIGVQSQVHLALFMVACWPFNIVDARLERRLLAVLEAAPVAAFMAIQLGGVPTSSTAALSSAQLHVLSAAIGIISFAAFSLTLAVFYQRNLENEVNLEDAVGKLRAEVHARALAQQCLQEASERALSASRAKSRFLSVVSHELRTPLHGVTGATDLLSSMSLDSGQRQLADLVASSSRHLLHLIDGIIDMAELEMGAVQLSRVPFDPCASIEESVALLAPAAHAKGLELDLCIEPSVPTAAGGDPARLRQVISHLVTNAIKFTRDGWVYVVARGSRQGARVNLEVEITDTGPGVPEELRPSVFDDFFQEESMKHRGQSGVGVGLATCRMLVDLMKGKISLRQRLGGGSIFAFDVPLDAIEANALSSERELASTRIALRIENPRLASGVKAALARKGAQVVATADAGGLELIERRDGVLVRRCPSRATVAQTEGPCETAIPRPVRSSGLRERIMAMQDAGREPAPAVSSVLTSTGPRVLVAEDNATSRTILQRLLELLGARVVCVEDGVAAVEAWERQSFDLILLDVQMPRMDGLDAAHEIRSKEHVQRDQHSRSSAPPPTPIVIVTANTLAEQRERAHEIGVQGYLTKPCGKDQIAEALGRLGLLGGRRPAAAS